MTAVAEVDLATTVRLLVAGEEINVINEAGETPLNLCLGEGVTRLGLAEVLLKAGADPNSTAVRLEHEDIAQPMLHAFIEEKFPRRIIDMMIKAGANLEGRDDDDSTALLLAVEEGDLRVIELLIKAGANYDHVNKYGECVLNFLDTENSRKGLEVLNMLLKAGHESERALSPPRGGIFLSPYVRPLRPKGIYHPFVKCGRPY